MKKTLTATFLVGTFLASSAVAKIAIVGDARYRYATNDLYKITQAESNEYKKYTNLMGVSVSATATTAAQKVLAENLFTAYGLKAQYSADAASSTSVGNLLDALVTQFGKDFDPMYYNTDAEKNGVRADNRFRIGVKVESESGIGGYMRLRSDGGFFDTNNDTGRLRVDQAYVTAKIPGVNGLALKAGDFKTYLTPLHVFSDLEAYTNGVEVSYDSGTFKGFYRMFEPVDDASRTTSSNNLEYQNDMGLSASIQGVEVGVYVRSDDTNTSGTDEKLTLAYVEGDYSGVKFAGEYMTTDDTKNEGFYVQASMGYGEYEFGGFYLQAGHKAVTGDDFHPMGISVFGGDSLAAISVVKNVASMEDKITVGSGTTATTYTNPMYSTDDLAIYGGQLKAGFQGLDVQLSYGIVDLNEEKKVQKIGDFANKLSDSTTFYDVVATYEVGPVSLVATYGSLFGITSFGANAFLKF